MDRPRKIFHLIGWHDQGALGDDLLALSVRRIFDVAAEECGVDLSWSDVPEAADYILIGGGTLLGLITSAFWRLFKDASRPYSVFGTGFRRERRDIGHESQTALGNCLGKQIVCNVRGFLSQQFCVHAGVSVPEVICDPAIWFSPVRRAFDDKRFPCRGFHSGYGRGGGEEPQYISNRQMMDIVSKCIGVIKNDTNARYIC